MRVDFHNVQSSCVANFSASIRFWFLLFTTYQFHFFYDVSPIWTHFIKFKRIGLEYTEVGSIIIGLKTPEFFSGPSI